MSKPAFTWMGASALMSSGMQPCSKRQHLVEEEERRREARRGDERRGELRIGEKRRREEGWWAGPGWELR